MLQRQPQVEASESEEEEEEEEETIDERQSEEYRRQMRSRYIDLIKETNDKSDELCAPGSETLLKFLETGDEYSTKIVHAREGALDATFFAQSSKYSLEQLHRINLGKDWDPIDFVTKIQEKHPSRDQSCVINPEDENFTPVEINWNAIGQKVSGLFKRAPTITFMNGPIKVERKEKKRKERSKKDQDEAAEEKQPEEVTNQGNKDATTKEVESLYKSMRKRIKKRKKDHQEPTIELPNVILDPNSFTKTIENLFYFSFLVKEGKAGLEYDKTSNEMKTTLLSSDEVNTAEHKRNQSVLMLNLNMYNQMVEKYKNNLEGEPKE